MIEWRMSRRWIEIQQMWLNLVQPILEKTETNNLKHWYISLNENKQFQWNESNQMTVWIYLYEWIPKWVHYIDAQRWCVYWAILKWNNREKRKKNKKRKSTNTQITKKFDNTISEWGIWVDKRITSRDFSMFLLPLLCFFSFFHFHELNIVICGASSIDKKQNRALCDITRSSTLN